VRVIGAGRLRKVEGAAVEVEHEWVENHERRRGRSRYEGLTTDLPVGTELRRGQALGKTTRLQLHLPDSEEAPSDFIALRASLPIPSEEPILAMISHDDYELRLYERGVEKGRYAVSFGQAQGVKEQRGDNRSPKGMYFVVARSQGPFSGPVGEYYGGHWIKINYPNPWDARRGRERGWISPAQEHSIRRAWSRRQLTAQDTRLGGGIGLHGWAWEWPDEGPRHLSWGCVVLHLRDVGHIYAALPEGSMVILL
jgi:L,D-transpeptidase catalytic domain